MDLFILRHGKSGIRTSAPSDFKRKLSEVGKKEVEEISKVLQRSGIQFDYIITSPLKRALQTAEIILENQKTKKNNFLTWNELKPESKIIDATKKISKLKIDSSVLIVGHDPHLSMLIGNIITSSSSNVCSINLKKAGLAKIRLHSFSPELKGELRWLVTPKQIKNFSG